MPGQKRTRKGPSATPHEMRNPGGRAKPGEVSAALRANIPVKGDPTSGPKRKRPLTAEDEPIPEAVATAPVEALMEALNEKCHRSAKWPQFTKLQAGMRHLADRFAAGHKHAQSLIVRRLVPKELVARIEGAIEHNHHWTAIILERVAALPPSDGSKLLEAALQAASPHMDGHGTIREPLAVDQDQYFALMTARRAAMVDAAPVDERPPLPIIDQDQDEQGDHAPGDDRGISSPGPLFDQDQDQDQDQTPVNGPGNSEKGEP